MHAPAAAQIGPNAIIQTIDVLQHRYGTAATTTLLHHTAHPDLQALNQSLPTSMVAEDLFHTLVAKLEQALGAATTASVLEQSGQQTADYLLAHRIPRPFQQLVRPLPARAGLALFLAAIKQHAWTFVGSGSFAASGILSRSDPRLTLTLPPMARPPVAAFYAGTFSRLFQTLISPTCRLTVGAWHAPHHAPGTYQTCIYTVELMPARKESETCVS